jgi:oxygen-independent coproporphyrinogen-3 oxidase
MSYEFWREYPDHDPQSIVWYPLTYGPLDGDHVWPREGATPEPSTSFYVHVPFCAVLCPFCPFNKFSFREQQARDYVDALTREISLLAERRNWAETPLRAGYFGGGTPTTLAAAQLGEIIEHLRRTLAWTEGMEFTVEGSPETITAEKLERLGELGVNRISFGVQSFSDRYLKMLGRGHDAATARRAVDLVRNSGVENVAIDLMYRLPGQTLADLEADLAEAVRADVDHISAYSLFVEPGAPLARIRERGKLLPLPNEEEDLELFRFVIDFLADAGYELYTLYDFARPGKKSDHHLVNWQAPQAEYVGLGPGAFSFVRNGEEEFVYGNVNPLADYFGAVRQNRLPIDFGVSLPRDEQMARYMVLGVNGLRIPKQPFEQRFGVTIDAVYGSTLEQLQGWGLIENSPASVDLTAKGKLYIANVGKAFVTEANRMKPHPAGVDLQKGAGESLVGITRTP